tara:strand:- start:4585 stop:5139 length:555 start_codon:yes stop_codon:yes gene_type:complete
MATVGGPTGPQSTQPGLLSPNPITRVQLTCKTSKVTYILIAIFVLNIVVILYVIKEEFADDILHYSNIMSVIYYSLMILLTYQFKCSPTTSLLFHPPIFVIVFAYVVLMGIHGLSNLYFISQTKESSYLFDLFKQGVSKANEYVKTTGKDLINDAGDAVMGPNDNNNNDADNTNESNVESFLNY